MNNSNNNSTNINSTRGNDNDDDDDSHNNNSSSSNNNNSSNNSNSSNSNSRNNSNSSNNNNTKTTTTTTPTTGGGGGTTTATTATSTTTTTTSQQGDKSTCDPGVDSSAEAIDTLRLSTGWIWWLRIPEPTVIPSLIKAGECWREQVVLKGSKLKDTPLRQAMFWSLMETLGTAIEGMTEAATKQAKESGWVNELGHWVSAGMGSSRLSKWTSGEVPSRRRSFYEPSRRFRS